MLQFRVPISSRAAGSFSLAWVISIIWLVALTPVLCTQPSVTQSTQSSATSGIQDTHNPRTSVAPLADADLLMRGMNMAWYTNTQEGIAPYWFKVGLDLDLVRADLDALQKLGVRHVRISALIFQFLNWHQEFGSMGLNASVISSFNLFLDEVENREMILTVSFLGPLWAYSEYPSLMQYFRIFNETTGLGPSALFNLGQAIVTLAEHYRTHDAIHTWELVGSFSRFTAYLSNTTTGFGLTIDSTALFDFFEVVADNIRAVDNEHFVTISDGWPSDYDAEWESTGLIPLNYDERLPNMTDYIALRRYSDNTSLHLPGVYHKPCVITEIASSQLYNYSREVNSEVLLRSYAEAINLSYSGFCPWEFSENIVIHEVNDTLPNHQRHDWTWDALLLFSLYRTNSVKFVETSNWYILSSEPQFDDNGRISFSLFHRPEGVYPPPFGFEDGRSFDPAEGGTIVTILSPNLLFGDARIVNQNADTNRPLYDLEPLGTCEYATTLATIYGTGDVIEVGIRLESNHTWESTVERYDQSVMELMLNATGPVSIDVASGNFVLIEGKDYTVSYTDRNSGESWQEIVEADENRTLQLTVNESSIIVRITPSPDVLGMLSLGMSVSVIILSIVIFYYVDKRTPKE
jgi:hypothetical protein